MEREPAPTLTGQADTGLTAGKAVDITVCYARLGEAWQRRLSLAVGSTVHAAITASGWVQAFPDMDPWQFGVGVFSRTVLPDTVLQDGDRVEIYRPLVFDPMQSRLRRAAHRAREARQKGSNKRVPNKKMLKKTMPTHEGE